MKDRPAAALCARAPASSANLGPGFDVLGLALGLYVTVCVEAAPEFRLTSSGEGSEIPADRAHLAARVAMEVLGHDRLSISVHSEIPLARGLGSSAALALAAAAAAGAADPLAVATSFEGHPENAAASFAGGLVAAAEVEGKAVVRSLQLDERLGFVALVPDQRLSTAQARASLAATVSRLDATFNLGRMGLLLAGLARREQLVAAAFEDRLHQRQRSPLFPQAEELIQALEAEGALGACWSGAGPTILAVCLAEEAETLAGTAASLMAEAGVAGRALRLDADRVGLRTGAPAALMA